MQPPFTSVHIGPQTESRPNTGAQPEYRASYTDAVVDLLLRRAVGSNIVSVDETAAVEFAIGLIARCFAVAELDPPIAAVTPSYLADTARRLLVSGNAVAAIDVSRRRGLTLIPASSFDLGGGPLPDSWQYNLELPGPTRNESRMLPYASVIHVKANADAAQPWIGISPLTRAGFTSTLVARLEQRMSEESRSRTGYLLPTGPLTEPQKIELQDGLKAMAGNVALVQGNADGWESGNQNAAKVASDWQPRRFGADIPTGNLTARRDASMDIVAALGVPSVLFVGANSGTGLQESYRIFAVSTLEPLGELVAQELADKLDAPGLVMRFDRTAGSDVVRRATAFEKLVNNGVERGRAGRIAGVY